jgi:hypothetical protein
LLNWKYRSQSHFEVYWRLLHKRHHCIKSLKIKETENFTIRICLNCNISDNIIHAYINCSEIQKIWLKTTQLLRCLLDRKAVHISYMIFEIVLKFSESKIVLLKELQMRITLWHLAIIYTITMLRDTTLTRCQQK